MIKQELNILHEYRVNIYSSGKLFAYYIEKSHELAIQRLAKCKKQYPYLSFDIGGVTL